MAKTKPAKKAPKAKTAAKKDVLVVASKIKAYIRSKDAMCSAEAIPTVSDCVYCCLDRAIARTKANRRTTVKAQDF